jgi:hypothetical protein
MNHIGQETTFEVGGKTYKLNRNTINGVQRRFADWVLASWVDPRPALKEDLIYLPIDVATKVAQDAIAEAKAEKDFLHPAVQRAYQTPDGVAKQIIFLIAESNADVNEAQAEKILNDAIEEHGITYILEKLRVVSGVTPEGLDVKKNKVEPADHTHSLKSAVTCAENLAIVPEKLVTGQCQNCCV